MSESRKLAVYLVGPMRGVASWNFPAFRTAETLLKERGYHVFSPATICEALGYASFDEEGCYPDTEGGRSHLEHVMLSDFACICRSDALALLPGWERSKGSTVEVALAQFLGLKLLDATTGEDITNRIPDKPWSRLVIDRTRKIEVVSINDDPPTTWCSYCGEAFLDEEDRTPTVDEKGKVQLCRACYKKAGNSVR